MEKIQQDKAMLPAKLGYDENPAHCAGALLPGVFLFK